MQISKENTCVGDTFLKSCNPEDSEICKIFKDANFDWTAPVAASDF